MQRKLFMLTAMCVVALAPPALAHHSHNGYEVTVWTTMEGTVSELHLIVPHSWLYLDVEGDDGETTTWALEAAGPNRMIENGAKREDVQVGDRVKVRCHLLRDGSNGCLLGFVTPDHGEPARGHGVEVHWD